MSVIKHTAKQQTMSSVEIVKIINELRENGKPELQHSDFLKKIIKVLGEEAAGNFSGSYKGKDNTKRKCYYLPRREACLMVMSESYSVQAKVYDRMDELEKAKAEHKSLDSITMALKMLPLAFKAAKILGLDKNETILSANKFVMSETGINMLEKLGRESIESETQQIWHNVTEIGKQIGLSAQSTNKLLETAGLQSKIADTWVATNEAIEKGYARVFDSGKKHNNGVSIQQVKWADSVIKEIQPQIQEPKSVYSVKHLHVIPT